MRRVKLSTAAILAVSLILNAVPVSGIMPVVRAADLVTEFTDEEGRSGWTKASGNGTIEFTDGEGENGYMTLTSNGNTIFADTAATAVTDGYVEMDITRIRNARFAIAFRYKDAGDWTGIGVDSGNWTWFTGADGWGSAGASKQSFTSDGEKHKIRVEYRGKVIRVLEDGTEIINKEFSALPSPQEGTIGMRLWGDKETPTGDYSCSLKIDNVKTGKLTPEAVITPENIRIPYADAGKTDYDVTLNKDAPALTGIKNAGQTLVKGTDYTVSDHKVTIKKEYIASIKESPSTELIFEFEDGQEKSCSILIEKQEETVSYTRDFKDGIEGFEMVSGNGTMTAENNAVSIQGNGLFIDQNSKELKNQEVEFTYDPLNNNTNYGVVLRYTSPDDYLYVGPSSQNNQHYTKWGIYGPGGRLQEIEDSGFVLEGRVVPYKVKVRVVDNVVTIFVDNEEIYNGVVNNITMKPGKTGFRTTGSTGMKIQKLTQETALKYEPEETTQTQEIASGEMTVKMDKSFPRVAEYRLATGEVVKGQELALHYVEINNKVYKPEVTAAISGDTARYTVTVSDIGISFDVVFTVKKQMLTMDVENVTEGDNLLYTLNFPRQSLISMSGAEPGAEIRVNNYRNEKRTRLAAAQASEAYEETTLAVLSSSTVAAAVSGESYKNRHEMAYQTFDAGDHTSTGIWVNEYTYRGLDGEKMYNPKATVSITTDRNKDGKVDYQDGAIALRDDCRAPKVGADTVTDSWNMIAMNVGSEAQYPFLRILDNAKKVSLATDNFAQNIIIKGYQSEGHDASHPDFANYNKRAGGLEDFNTLLENKSDYNTKIGVHINQTDVYPESPQFDKLKTDLGAWSWYDSALQIVRENDGLDKTPGGMDGRLAQLLDTDTKGNLDTVYVDVFFGTRWPLYKLVQNINGKGRDMALGTEYVDEMVSSSVFAHHIGSNFGGAGSLVRIVDNNQADIFANHQLFRGASSRSNDDVGIDGWQSAKNLNNALQAFYERILPNKFMAQYPVMQYESDNKAVLGKENQVVTEMKNGVNVITKDGHEVANGNKIFIPWEEGKDKEGKIYHWNREGGETTWTLPKSWGSVSSAVLYKLSDEGKVKVENGVTVQGGNQVTINAEPKTGYVLYKSDAVKHKTAQNIEWSTGSPVKDMGFDSHDFKEWKPESTAGSTDHIMIENNSLGNSHLYIKGTNDGKVTQTLKGLTPGQTYAASVWCITPDGRKASIEVKNGDETKSNYMDRSNVVYGVHHNDKYKTKAQRMQVRFKAKSDTAVLTLSAAKGADEKSVVDFDDVRVAKVQDDTNPDPVKNTYWEDFENTDQGWGVFVSPESDQSHLSQRNPVNPEATTDVIDGTYSLKIRAGDYMRTIPATMRLEPETEYTVGIEYKSPSANAFTFAVKSDKAREAGDTAAAELASQTAVNKEGKLELKFTTGSYDDYYVDVTKKGGSEYYLDNFYVQEARPINLETLGLLIQEAEALQQSAYTPESYAELLKAKSAAEKVLHADEPQKEQIKKAYKDLEKAIAELDAYAAPQDKAGLQKLVDEMKMLLPGDYKPDEKWMGFQTEIKEAEKMLDSDTATKSDVESMISRLQASKDALNPVVDRTALKEIMKKAEKVDRNIITDGQELQTFLSAIEDAKKADLKPGVTEAEIKHAAETLTAAYNGITIKSEAKDEVLASALDKANGKGVTEEYFLEKDWQAITEAKAELTRMQGQDTVKAADYYGTLDKLETALANKLSRPVVPVSVEIPASSFASVTANTFQPGTAGEGPVNYAFDNDVNTIWHSAYAGGVSPANPAIVEIDMGKMYTINQFSYIQRPSGGNGKIQKFNLYVQGRTRADWTKVVADGTFKDKPGVQKVAFGPVEAGKVKLEVTQGVGGFASAAELKVYQKASDFAVLQQMMNEIDKLDENAYTKASYAAVKALYSEAEEMLKNLTTQQDKIDKLASDMKRAKDELILVATPTDILTLENAVSSAKKINLKDYKDTKAFEKALKEAETLLDEIDKKKEVTQDEVSRTALKLSEEQKNLKPAGPTVDKTALQTAIDNAIPDDQAAKYTEESWREYKSALLSAMEVLGRDNVTQKEVDSALDKLEKAKQALKESGKEPEPQPTPPEPNPPGPIPPGEDPSKPIPPGENPSKPTLPGTGTEKPGTTKPNNTEQKPAGGNVQTGDTNKPVPAAAGAVLGLGAIIAVLVRKLRRTTRS